MASRRLWLFSCLAAAAVLAENEEIFLWPQEAPGDPPGFAKEEKRSLRRYKPSNYEGTSIEQVSRPSLTPFLVEGSKAAVIVAPGGSYIRLAFTVEGVDLAKKLNSFGVSAFVLKYRVPLRPSRPGLPWNWAQLQDAQRALGLVRGRAASWGLDASKIGFLGFSAGGNLAASLAGNSRRIYPAVDEHDEVSCRPDRAFLVYPWKLVGEGGEVKEELNVTRQSPPSFIITALNDVIAPPVSSQALYRALKGQNVEVALHEWADGAHGFGLCQRMLEPKPCCTWPDLLHDTLKQAGWTRK